MHGVCGEKFVHFLLCSCVMSEKVLLSTVMLGRWRQGMHASGGSKYIPDFDVTILWLSDVTFFRNRQERAFLQV